MGEGQGEGGLVEDKKRREPLSNEWLPPAIE